MAWAIVKIYTFKCAQVDPKQLPKTSKFYSRSKKCDIEETLGSWYHPPWYPKVKYSKDIVSELRKLSHAKIHNIHEYTCMR